MATIIGRKREIDELMAIYHRHQAQLVAVYGRRRVGKTYLVRELFKDKFAFYHTGVSPVELQNTNLLEAQLTAFNYSMQQYGGEVLPRPDTWMEAFNRLKSLLLQHDPSKRIVVFLDEMPWMDTPRSGFITAFEYFWNGWASGQDNLMVIVCGSATSWIQDHLINSYGGLYDRVNAEIQLAPFTLAETEQLLQMQQVTLSRYDILQLYMAVGGIPMYLSYVQPGYGLSQTIDLLFFNRKAKLKDEFDRLFNSIFRFPEAYKNIIRILAKRQAGYTRAQIGDMADMTSGRGLTEVLKTLIVCDFIEQYLPFGANKREKYYRLTDPYCLFYLNQVENKGRGENFWQDNENQPALANWRGRAFEVACLMHVDQIKGAMGVRGIGSVNSPWVMRGVEGNDGMQIDLVINRNDRVINLCEMKFVNTEFEVKKEYEQKLRHRLNWMTDHVSPRHNVQMTLVTTYGLKYGIHSSVFQRVVTMDSLFNQ